MHLLVSYPCDLFFIFIFIFIMINHAISLKQTYFFFFARVLEYFLLFLDDNVDEEHE